MVVGEANINNIMSGIESTGGVRLHNHRKKLKQRFDIIKKLGQGTYGKVQLGINKETGQEVAIKTIKKCKIETEADLIRIRREIQIMSSVQHPNIIHIYEVFENREKMVLVMEYAAGGELYDYLSERKVLAELEARRIFRQIATAVYYCHKHKICHRDLKLENILLDENGNAKIADFGLSNVFDDTRLLATFCGSPLYASPEIVKGTPYHGPEVDCWSLGVLLYTLVYGAMPFDGSNFKRLVKQISQGDYFEPKTPSPASPLIREMLTVSATRRADMEKICAHWWVNEGHDDSCLDQAEELANQTPVRLDLLLSLVPPPPEVGSDKLVIADPVDPPSEATLPTRSVSAGSIMDAGTHEDVTSPKRKLEVTISTENANKPKKERSRKKDRDTSSDRRNRASSASKDSDKSPENRIKSPELRPSSPEKSPENHNGDLEVIEDGAMCTELIEEAKKRKPKKVKDKIDEEVEDKENEKVEIKEENKESEVEVPAEPPSKPVERRRSKIFETVEKFQNSEQPQSPEKPKKIFIPGVNVGGFKEAFERKASLTNSPPINLKKSPDETAPPESPKEDKTEKMKQAVSIISNAIDREGARKSKSRPTMIRKPPVPFGVSGRSASGGIANLISPIKTRSIPTPEETEETKKSSLEVSLKSATLPRRKTSKAEITLTYPQPKPATMEFKTEMQHRIENPKLQTQRSEVAFPVTQVPKVGFRSNSLEPESQQPPKERIIPIAFEREELGVKSPPPVVKPPAPRIARPFAAPRTSLSRQSTQDSDSESTSTTQDPIKKSPREYIIPIAIEGGGYVTPRSGSLEPSESGTPTTKFSGTRFGRPRRMNSLRSDREGSEDESPFSTLHRHSSIGRDSDNDDSHHLHLHRLRSSRPTKRLDHADSLSSGEEDDDDGFELLTAENLFSTLLSRVRSLTQRLNVEDGGRPGFPSSRLLGHFGRDNFWDNIHSREPFRNSFGRSFSREKESPSTDSSKSAPWRRTASATRFKTEETPSHTLPRDSYNQNIPDLDLTDLTNLKISEKDALALSYLTPGLSRRIKKQLLSQLQQPRKINRTQSMQNDQSSKITEDHRLNRTRSTKTDTLLEPTKTRTEKSRTPDYRRTLSLEPSYKSPQPELLDITRPRERSPYSESSRSELTDLSSRSDLTESDRRLLENYRMQRERRAQRSNSLLERYKTPEKSVLSKYLEPSKSYTEPIKSYTTPRRVSRFLRPDFYDTPPPVNEIKDKRELETQKVLKEIREKRLKKRLETPEVPSEIDVAATKTKIAKLIRPNSFPEKPEPKRNRFLQSLEKQFEKFRSSDSKVTTAIRRLREQSLPRSLEPITESGLIKRAVSVEDLSTLNPINANPKVSRNSVSKILSLFQKDKKVEKKVKKKTDSKSKIPSKFSKKDISPPIDISSSDYSKSIDFSEKTADISDTSKSNNLSVTSKTKEVVLPTSINKVSSTTKTKDISPPLKISNSKTKDISPPSDKLGQSKTKVIQTKSISPPTESVPKTKLKTITPTEVTEKTKSLKSISPPSVSNDTQTVKLVKKIKTKDGVIKTKEISPPSLPTSQESKLKTKEILNDVKTKEVALPELKVKENETKVKKTKIVKRKVKQENSEASSEDFTKKSLKASTSKLPVFRRSLDLGETVEPPKEARRSLNFSPTKSIEAVKDTRKSLNLTPVKTLEPRKSLNLSPTKSIETETEEMGKENNKRKSLQLDFSKLPRLNIESIQSIEPAPEVTATLQSSTKPDESLLSPQDSDHWSTSSPEEYRQISPSADENESVIDRIRRKSFYSRFNEKKKVRKSTLVGPGADYNNIPYKTLPRRVKDDTKIHLEPLSPLTFRTSSKYDVESSSCIPRKVRNEEVENSGLPSGNLNSSISQSNSTSQNSTSQDANCNIIENNNDQPDH